MQYLNFLLKSLLYDDILKILKFYTYIIIIAIVRRKNVVSLLSNDVIHFRTFLVTQF